MLRFEPNLKHQRDAIQSTVRVFDGAPWARPEERFWNNEVSGNVLKLTPDAFHANIQAIARENGITRYAPTDELDLTIEMETGTGKTYVYLRTIYELHKAYDLHKFIIVVPSVAVREGVMTALRLTRDHFQELYRTTTNEVVYNAKKPAQIQSWCHSNALSILVMNMQAFNRDDNVMNDALRDGGAMLEALRRTRPIFILDEPQEGMDTCNMRKRLAAFAPLFKLRYSATHKEPKNIIYRLTPYDAYNQGLVKKIAVLSVAERNTQSTVAIAFRKLKLSAKEPTATLALNLRLKGGEIKEKALTVKRRDDLEERTGNPVYHGWIVEDIGKALYENEEYVQFTNGERIVNGGRYGVKLETIFREQIRRTIDTHYRRKKRLLELGIKPLALFFIDRVANYVQSDGLIRRLFLETLDDTHRRLFGTPPRNPAALHGGYFAKTGAGEYTDAARSMTDNAEIYELIMKDKERLLSPDEPLEFIFSHSALGVGWDNPNVFTICTLNESHSLTRKRQEIGRGLRLCVDAQGRRYRDAADTPEGQEVNLLTVVANESYYAFAKSYQLELQEELGAGAQAPPVRNAAKEPTRIRRNAERFASQDFTELWKRIARKTRCRPYFEEEVLVRKGIERLSSLSIDGLRLETRLVHWRSMDAQSITAEEAGVESKELRGAAIRMDLVDELARNTAMAHATAAAILAGMPDAQKRMLARNPVLFLSEAARKLRRLLEEELVRLVKYETTDDCHPLELLEAETETQRDVTPTPKRGLYDYIIPDSAVEERFAQDLENDPAVRLFLKLPAAYKVPTPIGDYSPDFALVLEKKRLDAPDAPADFYFVVETKGAADLEGLRPDEALKIRCAVKHFEALGLAEYLAPVSDFADFERKAAPRIAQTR